MQHAGQADRLASRSVSRPHTESWHGCAGPPCLLSACTEFQIFATKLGDISDMTRYSLDELRQRYVVEGRPLEASLEEVLRADTRAGARAILASVEKRRFENRSEGQRLRKMLRFETLLWDQGQDAVAGVDEAGMSPLAGPVSAAAVILKPGTRITGIDDSKKLDASSREALAVEIKEKAVAWSVAFVEVEEIDTINIYWAGILAMRRAVEGLGVTPQHLLIDAKRLKEITIPQQAIIKGDAKSASIAAASILAKVSRDALMRALDTRHPGYGFADHKGYPVRAHYDALSRLGACAAHRRSFGPVREVLGLPPLPPWPPASERGGSLSGAEALRAGI
jgi:ribonuclease HII